MRRRRDKDERRFSFGIWLERLLLCAGTVLLALCAAMVGEAVIAQQAARSALEAAMRVEPLKLAGPVDAGEATVARDVSIATGAPIGVLSIPRVELSAAVLHGSDPATLRRGPGHLENSAYPGDAGNVVIAGHRDSFFWSLRNVQVNDDVFLDTPRQRFHYRVTSLEVVVPRDVSVLAHTDRETLTLITCYPFWVLGSAPDRFVVRAVRADPDPH
jgi:sortase A